MPSLYYDIFVNASQCNYFNSPSTYGVVTANYVGMLSSCISKDNRGDNYNVFTLMEFYWRVRLRFSPLTKLLLCENGFAAQLVLTFNSTWPQRSRTMELQSVMLEFFCPDFLVLELVILILLSESCYYQQKLSIWFMWFMLQKVEMHYWLANVKKQSWAINIWLSEAISVSNCLFIYLCLLLVLLSINLFI